MEFAPFPKIPRSSGGCIITEKLDGTNAWQRFRNVTVPGIRSSLIVVLTTITIASLKVYDIVAVMTGGRDETTVLGFEMVNQQQRFQSYGHSSALAVVR